MRGKGSLYGFPFSFGKWTSGQAYRRVQMSTSTSGTLLIPRSQFTRNRALFLVRKWL